MNRATVRDNQSWFDLAIQLTGSVENVFSIMTTTDLISDLPAHGRLVETTESSNQVLTYYSRYKIAPATGIIPTAAEEQGIGYWAIDIDFEIQ